MADSKIDKNAPTSPADSDDFKGYTMEELRYQRAMMALRKEFCKSKVLNSVDRLTHPAKQKEPKALPGVVGNVARVAQTVGKFIPKLSVLEYASIALSAAGSAHKIYKMIGGKKKK